MLKVIKSKADYDAALAVIDRLIALDPEPGTSEANELEVLTVLVKDYEEHRFPTQVPDAIEAVQFRMEQMGLSHRDLVPFIGSRGRVSEVLARKRPLSLAMLKSLHAGLGIPAAVLLRGEEMVTSSGLATELARFPVKEMIRRNWLTAPQRSSHTELTELLKRYLAPLTEATDPVQVLTRMTMNQRADRPSDRHALMAWTARVLQVAKSTELRGGFAPGAITDEALRGLVHLSVLDDGPRKAQEYLSRYGVALVVVQHLPGTRLDGAALFSASDRPVVALTLRYDRVDSFWFTLLHEIGHLMRHLQSGPTSFLDDLESSAGTDPYEAEADAFARDTLIPMPAWEGALLQDTPNPAYVRMLAKQLGIHPAIVAGRVRKECGNYRLLSNLVGTGEVRHLFARELGEVET